MAGGGGDEERWGGGRFVGWACFTGSRLRSDTDGVREPRTNVLFVTLVSK